MKRALERRQELGRSRYLQACRQEVLELIGRRMAEECAPAVIASLLKSIHID
eukprot:COSAG01_NODE_9420_length_2451_cov_1.966837_2_plen_52_part_00